MWRGAILLITFFLTLLLLKEKEPEDEVKQTEKEPEDEVKTNKEGG